MNKIIFSGILMVLLLVPAFANTDYIVAQSNSGNILNRIFNGNQRYNRNDNRYQDRESYNRYQRQNRYYNYDR